MGKLANAQVALGQQNKETGPLMTVRETADYLAVTEGTVCRLVKECNLPARWVGGQWRFRAESIDAWIRGDDS